MFEKDNQTVSILGAFALGLLLGASVGMLMAPKSGQETRGIIRDKSIELKDRAATTAGETRHRAGQALDDLANQTKEKVSSITQRGQEMVEEHSA